VYNNSGWRAPKFSTLAIHPEGYASKTEDLNVSFDPPPDYCAIAASCGAFAAKVTDPGALDEMLERALEAVLEEGRSAVLDVVVGYL
jgi:acetolactate synthase-1/2/3 large subunit